MSTKKFYKKIGKAQRIQEVDVLGYGIASVLTLIIFGLILIIYL